MTTIDERVMNAPAEVCFRVAADVEHWPDILPHYRWVRFQRKYGFALGRVEMAARRDFGPIGYPVWWVSEMWSSAEEPAVYYRHVDGITRGMDVKWSFHTNGGRTLVRITHEWSGPRWPLISGIAANAVIGPHFISAVAARTLAGVAAEAERRASGER